MVERHVRYSPLCWFHLLTETRNEQRYAPRNRATCSSRYRSLSDLKPNACRIPNASSKLFCLGADKEGKCILRPIFNVDIPSESRHKLLAFWLWADFQNLHRLGNIARTKLATERVLVKMHRVKPLEELTMLYKHISVVYTYHIIRIILYMLQRPNVLDTYLQFIHEEVAEASQIFLWDAHVLRKFTMLKPALTKL
jgi:hypothetical protein